jgi:hypothetical protein
MRTRNGQTHRIAVADAVCNPRRADVRGADESARNCNRVAHTHGGLTPAALANVRFCIADGALCSKHTPCNQERLALVSRGGRNVIAVGERTLLPASVRAN